MTLQNWISFRVFSIKFSAIVAAKDLYSHCSPCYLKFSPPTWNDLSISFRSIDSIFGAINSSHPPPSTPIFVPETCQQCIEPLLSTLAAPVNLPPRPLLPIISCPTKPLPRFRPGPSNCRNALQGQSNHTISVTSLGDTIPVNLLEHQRIDPVKNESHVYASLEQVSSWYWLRAVKSL